MEHGGTHRAVRIARRYLRRATEVQKKVATSARGLVCKGKTPTSKQCATKHGETHKAVRIAKRYCLKLLMVGRKAVRLGLPGTAFSATAKATADLRC